MAGPATEEVLAPGTGARNAVVGRLAPRKGTERMATKRQRTTIAEVTEAVVYCRVSTEEQARTGVGLDAQERVCREHCARRGWTVRAVHRDEGVSGRETVAGRPGLTAAIEEATTQGAVLVAYSVSRVSRRQRVLWELLDPAVPVAPVLLSSATEPFDTTTPMGRAMLGMIAVWSALEADMISERTRDALATVRARGKRLGAPPMSVSRPESVERIQQLRREGLSLRAIAERLNAEEAPTARLGGRWWPKTVITALKQSEAS